MTARRAYPSDLSDARWALIEPTLTAWRQARLDRRPTGEQAPTYLRDIFDAILYVNRTGIAWKYLPHDFPNHRTVYGYYAAWRDEGVFAQLNYELTGLARIKEGRAGEPSAAVIDTQSMKTSTNPPTATQGTDAAKLIVGRKRSIATDALRLLLAVVVCAASTSENKAGMQVLDQAKHWHPTITKSWVDQGFKNQFVEHAATFGVDAEVVTRDPGARAFRGQAAVGSRAHARVVDAAPQARPRLRDPTRELRGDDPHRDDRQHRQADNGRIDTYRARRLLVQTV